MSNPRFLKAMEGAMRGEGAARGAVGQALKQMNVPTRTELKRALSRIETLEREVTSLKTKAKARPAARRKPVARKPVARKAGAKPAAAAE